VCVVRVTCVLFKIWHLRAGYLASNIKRFFEAGSHQDMYVKIRRHQHTPPRAGNSADRLPANVKTIKNAMLVPFAPM